MLRYIYADSLDQYPRLAATMFRDRARQFAERLGWQVEVNEKGEERDEYDALNPLYVIWERPDGSHGGSMRFLPTVERCMINEHFRHLTGGVRIESPLIWECTRFCLAPDSDARVSAALMLGGLELGLGFHLAHSIGVFDARMLRVYRRLGWEPTVIGQSGEGRAALCAGLWEFDPTLRPRLLARAGVSAAQSRRWFARAFTAAPKARPVPA
ncbi:acyl homoserine lactone synthase [Meinhardsimonia xiamenensis]|jgi:acyl homoserine lactone synthase|uniref:Acyl-homoserine-lactone synthase n=1 Tax=Meinhardsimonia xiamenensis TaxID=990712 RepID=A0A1G8Z3H8_9RHOB|nr:acyl-homoserine-lactone synthase [Meinhardsimonia xiamenensis]PRX37512.1 acyl homoserine lactone synthase [Meinhardsimonia xiamenensis]SDK08790.1 acyl homoserine lactone synthase [Meinhardsimonia xiamenensis]